MNVQFFFFPLRNSYRMTLLFSSSANHFRFVLPKTKDCAESRVTAVTDVWGSSHVLIGNPFWSHSKYGKLFFLESFGWFLCVCFFFFPPKSSSFLLQVFYFSFFLTADEFRNFRRAEWPGEWSALNMALEWNLLPPSCVWGRGLVSLQACVDISGAEAPWSDRFQCI